MQGFATASHIVRFESTLNAGGIYKLNKFTLVPARDMYKVSANKSVAVFSDQITLAEIDGAKYEFMPQAFIIRSYKELSSIAAYRNGDLFDILGCIKNVTGDDLGTPARASPIAEQVSSKSKERVVLHVELDDKQRGSIGLSIYAFGLTPYTTSNDDETATQRPREFFFGWMLKPLVFGDYPDVMKRILGQRLPVFSK